jgi:DNA-binding LacI/PurR family transcriptional regulator
MKPIVRSTVAAETAKGLGELLNSGHWGGAVPGVVEIAKQFRVSKFSARGALKILESEGILKSRGAGRARLFISKETGSIRKSFRIGILPTIPLRQDNAFVQQIISMIREDVEQSGHHCFISSRSLSQLGHNAGRVLKHIQRETADAWITYRANRDVLAEMAGQTCPVYALGGYYKGLPVAGSVGDIHPALKQAIEELTNLGHRKIVTICSNRWRHPKLIPTAEFLLDTLSSKGITVGDYNMPDWTESPEGLADLLESMFLVTPPTALLVVEPSHAVAVLSFLARKRLRVPEDVSLLTTMIDPIQEWHQPPLTKLLSPTVPHVRHIRRWLAKISSGKVWHDQLTIPVGLLKGSSFGKACS